MIYAQNSGLIFCQQYQHDGCINLWEGGNTDTVYEVSYGIGSFESVQL
jgi:hypothetical protein